MKLFFKELFCIHNYENIKRKQPKPFDYIGYPVLDDDGYWLYDMIPFECTKCEKIVFREEK